MRFVSWRKEREAEAAVIVLETSAATAARRRPLTVGRDASVLDRKVVRAAGEAAATGAPD